MVKTVGWFQLDVVVYCNAMECCFDIAVTEISVLVIRHLISWHYKKN